MSYSCEEYQIPTEDATQRTTGSSLWSEGSESLRSELLLLTEKHEIRHSVVYIKKASQSALEKIKGEYERKQLEETNEYLSETLMGKLSKFMEGLNMIDNAKSMEQELTHNKMVKRDLKSILGHITPKSRT